MREYTIYYTGYEDGEKIPMVGSGHGENGQQAVKDFLLWHDDCLEIRKVQFYKEYKTA